MARQLRTRLLAGGALNMLVVAGTITLTMVERIQLNADISDLTLLRGLSRKVQKLHLNVEYSHGDLAAYALGYRARQRSFAEHSIAASAILTDVERAMGAMPLKDGDARARLTAIAALTTQRHALAERLFAATANPTAPDPDAPEQTRQLVEASERLNVALTGEISALDVSIAADARDVEIDLEKRNNRLRAWVLGLGATTLGLILVIQLMTIRAVGAPLSALRRSVQRFSDGDMWTRVVVRRRDEIGDLGAAFNDMAAKIQAQTSELVHLDLVERARGEAEAARAKLEAQLTQIEEQRAVIHEIDAPILPITRTTLLMPLIGRLDRERMVLAQERALGRLAATKARFLILDVTGVPIIDAQVAHGLLRLFKAARLIGAEVILAGIRAETARTIVDLDVDLAHIATCNTLQDGVVRALHRSGQGKREG